MQKFAGKLCLKSVKLPPQGSSTVLAHNVHSSSLKQRETLTSILVAASIVGVCLACH